MRLDGWTRRTNATNHRWQKERRTYAGQAAGKKGKRHSANVMRWMASPGSCGGADDGP
jgi:hypothetical protein